MTEVVQNNGSSVELPGAECDQSSLTPAQVTNVENITPRVNGQAFKGDVTPENNVPSTSSAGQTDRSSKNTVNKNAKENFLDLLGNGSVTKKVLVKGNGITPDTGDIVTLKIEGHLSNGTVVDKYDAFKFHLGEGDVISALDLTVCRMENGEICELFAISKFAYGEKGREPDIPANSDITYSVELVRFEKKPRLDQISHEFKLEIAEKKRLRGNFLFVREEFNAASYSYTQAIATLNSPSATPNMAITMAQKFLDCEVKSCNNLAACELKNGYYDSAIKAARQVLFTEPNNVKALFRLGKAYAGRNDISQAIEYLKKALEINPESKIVNQELSLLTEKLKSEKEKEKEMYRKMLGNKKNKKEDTSKKSGSSWIKWTLLAGAVVAGLSIAVVTLRRNY